LTWLSTREARFLAYASRYFSFEPSVKEPSMPTANIASGSMAEVQPPYSLAAASEHLAAAQTRIFNFPNLTAAFEQSPDGQITRNTSSLQAASGSITDLFTNQSFHSSRRNTY
jgi:hypothetical protein